MGAENSAGDYATAADEGNFATKEAMGRMGREARAGNYFSFELKVDPATYNILLLTYIGDDKNRKFDILVDGIKLTTEEWNGGKTGKFYDKEYQLPYELTEGKEKVTVRIEAATSKTAGRIFGARMLITFIAKY